MSVTILFRTARSCARRKTELRTTELGFVASPVL